MHTILSTGGGYPQPLFRTVCDEVADMASAAGQNLHRMMAELDVTLEQVVRQSGLDKRTVKAILAGRNTPRPHTINRLAKGLNVPVAEFFIEPSQLLYRHIDRNTNPVVQEVVESDPELFRGWTQADFDEIHSRHGTGGPMTVEGILAVVHQMNSKRQLHQKLSVLLESGRADLIAGIVDVLYDQIVVRDQ